MGAAEGFRAVVSTIFGGRGCSGLVRGDAGSDVGMDGDGARRRWGRRDGVGAGGEADVAVAGVVVLVVVGDWVVGLGVAGSVDAGVDVTVLLGL